MPTAGRRLYYGWVIVAVGFCTMLLVQGSFASSGVLFAARTREHGWSRATISLPFSMGLVGYASMTWLSGRLFDRYGPRRVFPCGALCLGLACLAGLSPSASVWLLYGYILGLGLGFGVHGAVESTATADIFTARIWVRFSVPWS